MVHVKGVIDAEERVLEQVGVLVVDLERVVSVEQINRDDVGTLPPPNHCGTMYHVRLTTAMLADGARLGLDGKLYIFGGQWDRMFAAAVPTTHPVMGIALVLEVGYNEALRPHQLELTLRHADGESAGVRAGAGFTVGHPPLLEPGAPISFPLAMEQQGIVFEKYGRYEWLIHVDAVELGRLPIAVSPMLGSLAFEYSPQSGTEDPA